MRLDHYKKIGNNNIHLAAIMYNLFVILVLVLIISTILGTSLKRDLKSIELFNIQKKERKQARKTQSIGSEDELGLTKS